MTRKSKPAKPAGLFAASALSAVSGLPDLRAGQTPPAPKPDRKPAHLRGQPAKGGFDKHVKPVPLPGKSRGR